MTHNLMVQGTTSDAGKSTLVSALARVLLRQGKKVAPFKPQNMALNSAVTVDGGEIGRAQAVQALACGLPAKTDFNPVLLKPNSDIGCQVIINGKVAATLSATQYHEYKPQAMRAVLAAHARLEQEYNYILIEGAGSPAEINLRDRDIANMGFAEAIDCPVIIIADIDRGGVFAHLVGTLSCLSQSEQDRVVGFVINRFRGDPALLTSGLDWLEEKTGKPVLGVLPYLHGLYLDSEDSVQVEQEKESGDNKVKKKIKIVVPIYPRTSNHNDFDALRLHPEIDIEFIGPEFFQSLDGENASQNCDHIPAADLVILPGSKSTIADFQWLKNQGWQQYLAKHLRYGGKIIGICGGLQMLGKTISDPHAIENLQAINIEAFGWLPIHTELGQDKTLSLVSGQLQLERLNIKKKSAGVEMQGYEIHAGITKIEQGSGIQFPVLDQQHNEMPDAGMLSKDQQIFASYWHGLFDTEQALNSLISWAGHQPLELKINYQAKREETIDRLADNLEQNLDVAKLQQQVTDFYQSKKMTEK